MNAAGSMPARRIASPSAESASHHAPLALPSLDAGMGSGGGDGGINAISSAGSPAACSSCRNAAVAAPMAVLAASACLPAARRWAMWAARRGGRVTSVCTGVDAAAAPSAGFSTNENAVWAGMGLVLADGGALPDQGWAALLLPGGVRGPAFLVQDNFSAIEAYNRADSYVIAVGHLADRIGGGGPIRHDWPRDLRALTLAERQEMQSRLMAEGVYGGEADGKVGPLTLSAVKLFQAAVGLPQDSYASVEVLQALRDRQGPVIPPAGSP